MRQIFGEIRWEVKTAIFMTMILIFSVVGPFGSYNTMPLAERFTYWTVIMIGIGFFMHVFMTVALNSARLSRWNSILKVSLGAALAAVPGAAIVEFANEVFRPSGINMASLVRIWAQVTVIGAIVGTVEYIDWRPERSAAQPKLSPLHKRLPAELGRDIVSMSMQDHYVEVTTTQGKTMILMRFTDALREVAELDGLRTHRSHWVAIPHMKTLAKSGNTTRVTLSDGRQMPVSATYLDTLQSAMRTT
ncbi:LytTR family DNA-binding domain-containing protein [Yoonia sp. R2331]|uniref:LytTR family DNA-binding domain-containing protein n=1 Tax=Yoonia sp. R2331 TaxID=3237238 RepID=UPI0034E39C36